MKKALPYLLASLIVYFCFSFILWELNPQLWERGIRLGFIFSSICAVVITHCVMEIIKIKD
jgi:hypothetical protein